MTPLQQELISRDYKQSHEPHWKSSTMTDVLFSKMITDEKGKKYQICLWYYPAGRYGNAELPESIMAEVQFTGDGITSEHMDVKLFTKDVDKIEEVFENMWCKLGLGYYELWE